MKKQIMGRVVTFEQLQHYLETGHVCPRPYTSHADWACSIWNGCSAAVDALATDMAAHGFSIFGQAGKYYLRLMQRLNLKDINEARKMREHEMQHKLSAYGRTL